MNRFTHGLGNKLQQVRLDQPEIEEEEVELEQTVGMECAQQIPKTKAQNMYKSLRDKNYNWNQVRDKYTTQQLESMKTWLADSKLNDPTILNNNEEHADFNKLNKYQRFTYDIVKKHREENKQLLMILLGSAGTGKSFTVSALTKLNLGKIKKASPTAKAAFLINGIIIYLLFKN